MGNLNWKNIMTSKQRLTVNLFLKRGVDVAIASIALVCLSPCLVIIAIAIFLSDFKSPIYAGERVGRMGRRFRMLKFRSMQVGSDKNGPSSTSVDDFRITRVGRLIRRTKLDELPQLWNVLIGEMSIVGPRPQVSWAVDLYSLEELKLISVRPGLTDFASLIFRDEGEILAGSSDPDGDYLRLIAPGKNLLGLHYVETLNIVTDFRIMVATFCAVLGFDPLPLLPRSIRDVF